MGWQLRMYAFSKGLVDRSNHPRSSMRTWRRARLPTQQNDYNGKNEQLNRRNATQTMSG